MLKRDPLLEEFEKAQMQNSQPDYFKNLQVFEALYQEAKELGVFPLNDPLEGIDVDIHLAMVLNVQTIDREDRPRDPSQTPSKQSKRPRRQERTT